MVARFGLLICALADAFSPHANAFLMRSMRAESRKRRPLLAVFGMTVALLLTCALTAFIWWQITDNRRGTGLMMAQEWSFLRAMMVACTGVHAFIIIIVVANRSSRFFISEAQQNTLEQLLLTPAPPAELLLHISAHTFCTGMLLALVGLPLYWMWAALGGLTMWQLFGLYAMFARIAFSVPSPQLFVVQWRMRQQRGQQTPEERRRRRKQMIPGLIGVGISIGFQIFAQVGTRVLGKAYGAQLGALFMKLWAMLPGAVKGLLPTISFSWFYCWVLLVTWPLSWYRFHLAPLIFGIPLMLMGRALYVLVGAAFIEKNVPVMTAPAGGAPPAADITVSSLLPATAGLGSAIGLLFDLAFIGYVWQPLIASGALSWLVTERFTDRPHALAALTYWMLGRAALGTMAGLRERVTYSSLGKPVPADILKARGGQWLYWSSVPLARLPLILLVACALGGMWPLNAPTLIIAAKMLLLGTVLTGYCLAIRWWQARIVAIHAGADDDEPVWQSAQMQQAYRTRVWYFNAAWQVTWCVFLLHWMWPFVALLTDWPLAHATAALSPVVSLLSLTPRFDQFLQSFGWGYAHVPPWWVALLLQPLGALACCAFALRLTKKVTVVAGEAEDSWFWRQVERVRAWNERQVNRMAEGLSARYDNPVALKDLRARARRENWAVRDLAMITLLSMLILSIVAFMIWGTQLSGRPAQSFLLTTLMAQAWPEVGAMTIPAQIFVSVLIPLWGLEWVLIAFCGCSAGMAFDHERDSSTLGFMYITPMSDRQLFFGKWLGYSLDAWLNMVSLKPLFAVLVLGAAVSGAWQIVPLFVALALFTAALVFAVSAFAVAVSANTRTRTAGAAWSVLLVFVSQPALSIALFGVLAPPTLTGFIAPFIAFALAHLLFGALAMTWGTRILGKKRAGDVAFEGQKREN